MPFSPADKLGLHWRRLLIESDAWYAVYPLLDTCITVVYTNRLLCCKLSHDRMMPLDQVGIRLLLPMLMDRHNDNAGKMAQHRFLTSYECYEGRGTRSISHSEGKRNALAKDA